MLAPNLKLSTTDGMLLEVSLPIFSLFSLYLTPAYYNSFCSIRYYRKYIHKTEKFLSCIKSHKHAHLRCVRNFSNLSSLGVIMLIGSWYRSDVSSNSRPCCCLQFSRMYARSVNEQTVTNMSRPNLCIELHNVPTHSYVKNVALVYQ